MSTTHRPGLTAVTGAAGLVGSRIVQELVERGLPVVAIVRNALSAAVLEAHIPGVVVRIGSVDRPDSAPATLEGVETVINCAIAGSSGVPKNAYTRNRAIVDGILTAPGVKRLIHFSSVAVYGEVFAGIAEDAGQFTTPRPTSEYGRSKLDVERYALDRCRARGVACTVIRLGHVYGPSVYRSREILSLIEHRDFALPFDGRHPSNAVHLDLIGEALSTLVEAGTGPAVVNLWERTLTWRALFGWHAAAIGAAPVAGLDAATSRDVQGALLDRSVRRATTRWLKSLPVKDLARSPAVFDRVLMLLARAPMGLTDRARAIGRRLKGGPVAAPGAQMAAGLPPLYFSEGAPGPMLPLPVVSEATATARVQAMQDWYEGITRPPFAVR